MLDLSEGTKEDPYIIYVDGQATIGKDVHFYEGNFILYARDGITCEGELIPRGYSAESNNPDIVEMKYNSILNGSDRIPRIRETHCASLISPGSINLSGNRLEFCFAGVCYSEANIYFKGSLRGSVIAHEVLEPDANKVVLATQSDLRDMIPEQMSALIKKVTYRDYWMRKTSE